MNEQPIWKPHAVQVEVLTCKAYEILFGGSRGGGKTDAGQVWLIDPEYLKEPRYRALILRKDAVDLSDWIDRAKYMYGNYGATVVGNPPMIKFRGGPVFRMGHLKDKNSYEKYLGHEYQKILIEELTQIPQERYYTEILGSCRSSLDIKARIMSTTNPGGKGHVWVKRRFIDPAPPGTEFITKDTGRVRVFIPAGVEDNPTLVEKDPDYIKYLDGLQYKDKALYAAWRLGDWDAFEGQFFDTWKRDVHVMKPRYDLKDAPDTFSYRLCWDEGSLNPRAAYLLAQDYDNKVECIWEYYKAGETADVAAENIKAKLIDAGIYDMLKRRCILVYDPSMDIKSNQTGVSTSQIVADILDFNKQPGNNSRVEGWRLMKSYFVHSQFREPLFRVWDRCTEFIRTIPEMIYDDNIAEDLDTDLEDHALDAVRYGLMSYTNLPARMAKGKTSGEKRKPVRTAYRPRGGY